MPRAAKGRGQAGCPCNEEAAPLNPDQTRIPAQAEHSQAEHSQRGWVRAAEADRTQCCRLQAESLLWGQRLGLDSTALTTRQLMGARPTMFDGDRLYLKSADREALAVSTKCLHSSTQICA